ncbi:MAG: hypothetical protein KJ646_04100 [Nanoarchaeota archaeon]|nr:hypothetical protein [Nanoarchaeota archaeon]MBU4116951.1 hypothetical protein [Nanoarchaeota archaeon]
MSDNKIYSSIELDEALTLYHILKIYQSNNSHESEGRFNATKREVLTFINKVEQASFKDEPIFKKVIKDLICDYNLNK